ncbi:sushi, von Willebrand factor type A, EGF and pentraxin domain-containing protein 1-like [Pseudophryne corroboree]|uniref:sushi, von Willebrand factor type A, EGF and pentraxin domain-containing protein 1-like n=1 Tax=Pseudophryne corroboree TaxID=495146 RepID=UPI003081D827
MSYSPAGPWNLRIMLFSALAATVFSDCSKPQNLTHAVLNEPVTLDSYAEGTNFTYSCIPGYINIPLISNVTFCQNDSTWSISTDDFCGKVSCGIPDIVDNGEVQFTDALFESTATYKCNDGYILFGNVTRYCSADGRWNGTVPSCNQTCPDPPQLKFATITNTVDSMKKHYFPEAFTIFYKCLSGYENQTLMPTSITCQSDYTWSEIKEFCVRVSCGSPGEVQNGNIIMVDDKFQSKATFSCQDGYMLVGNTYRECMEDGRWSGSNPECKRSCPFPPVPVSAEIIEIPYIKYFPVGSYINYKCALGYRYDPFLPPNIQCQDSFVWSEITPFCSKVTCGDPEQIRNGEVQITGNDYGSIAAYSCNNGYHLIGNSQRKCTADGVWDGTLPVCQ